MPQSRPGAPPESCSAAFCFSGELRRHSVGCVAPTVGRQRWQYPAHAMLSAHRWGNAESLAELTTTVAPALEVRDLHVSYGSKVAVDGVSLQIDDGEIYGLLGPNGAGKTTTLSAVEGLLRPQSGSIAVAGVDIQADPLRAKACMGVQFQSTSFQAKTSVAAKIRARAAGSRRVSTTLSSAIARLRERALVTGIASD